MRCLFLVVRVVCNWRWLLWCVVMVCWFICCKVDWRVCLRRLWWVIWCWCYRIRFFFGGCVGILWWWLVLIGSVVNWCCVWVLFGVGLLILLVLS